MIDLHCHLLPEIDDGPPDMEGTLALAGAAVAAGTHTMVAAPHVNTRHPNTAAAIRIAVGKVTAALAEARIDLQVLPGAEIGLTRLGDLEDDELHALRLGTGPWLLIECPFTSPAAGFVAILHHVQARGHRIVLAHPERCAGFQRDVGRLRACVEAGMLTSLTASSLVGGFGEQVRRFALQLVADGLAHNVASDAHDAHHRPPGMGAQLARAGLEEQTRWLCEEVPAAIVGGEPLPARPAFVRSAPRPGRRWLRGVRGA